jgi:hypothetical protein
MGISDELQKLHDLHRQGALTDEEFARAKEALLARPAPDVQDQLAEIARRQEAERIDREWERERERLLVTGTQGGTYVDGKHVGGYPVRYVPTRTASVLSGVFTVAAGLVWMIVTASMGAGGFALFGLVFIAVGVGWAVYAYGRAEAYEQAERRYRQRRRRALGGDDSPEAPGSQFDFRE